MGSIGTKIPSLIDALLIDQSKLLGKCKNDYKFTYCTVIFDQEVLTHFR